MEANTIFQSAVESWRRNKGVGSMFCPAPLDNRIPLLLILQRLYNKSPSCSTIIIVDCFKDRLDLMDFLTTQEDENNNKEFKRLFNEKAIRILTRDFIISGKWNSSPFLGVLFNPESFDLTFRIWLDSCKFKLVILNKLLDNQDDKLYLNKICPLLNEFKQNEIDELRTNRPVEEMWVGVDIPTTSETYALLDYYNKEINSTITIFGSFDNIKFARIGNPATNMSAIEFCTNIAIENGWSDNLDMSTEYNHMLDATYNPNTLKDKAKEFYNIVRNRSYVLSDYEGKLPLIYNICKEHENEKILIISKRGEFASRITTYLNNCFGDVVCGNFHNKVENTVLYKPNGQPVLVKSGVNKGKPKQIGYKAQMSLNQSKFNSGELKIISTNNIPDKTLNINVDVVIITSPLCEDIKSYLYRLTKVNFRGDTIKLFSVFCKSTLEHKQLLSKDVSSNHVIVNKDENLDVSENNFDLVIAD